MHIEASHTILFLYMLEIFHDAKFLKTASKESTVIMIRSHITINLRISTSTNTPN